MVDEEIEQSPWRAVTDRGVGPRDVCLVHSGEIVASARFRCGPIKWQRAAAQRGDHLARDFAEDGKLTFGAWPRQVDVAEAGRPVRGDSVDECLSRLQQIDP